MKKILLLVIIILFSSSTYGQEQNNFFKSIYKDFLKYGTVYGAGDISNSIEASEPTYFLRTNPDARIIIPDVVIKKKL